MNEEQTQQPIEQSKDRTHLYTPAAVLLAGFMVSASLLLAGGYELPERGLVAGAAVKNEGGSGGAQLEITKDDHIRGNPNAKVTIVEFSDFQCPFCSRFHPTVSQALAEYGDDVRWVYKHFPLTQIHPEAVPAAEASECIAEQKGNEGFWQFGDALFENQARLGSALYRELAQQTGVNMSQFDACVSQRKYQDKVQADYTLGTQLGISGTPGGFVNATPIRGAIPYEQLKSMIDAELAK